MMFARLTTRTSKAASSLVSFTLRDKHTLPKLAYPAAEGVLPMFSGHQLNFHYNKHHKTYVDKLNQLVEGTEYETQPLDAIIRATAFDAKHVAIFNNAAQHFNHSFFWRSIKPVNFVMGYKENPMPLYVQQKLEKQFDTVQKFKKEFTEMAMNQFGSGWCWLVFDGTALKVWTGGNAATPIAENLVPILVVDVWEHSYYLDYQNRRAEYLDQFWKCVDWEFVESTLKEVLAVQDANDKQLAIEQRASRKGAKLSESSE